MGGWGQLQLRIAGLATCVHNNVEVHASPWIVDWIGLAGVVHCLPQAVLLLVVAAQFVVYYRRLVRTLYPLASLSVGGAEPGEGRPLLAPLAAGPLPARGAAASGGGAAPLQEARVRGERRRVLTRVAVTCVACLVAHAVSSCVLSVLIWRQTGAGPSASRDVAASPWWKFFGYDFPMSFEVVGALAFLFVTRRGPPVSGGAPPVVVPAGG